MWTNWKKWERNEENEGTENNNLRKVLKNCYEKKSLWDSLIVIIRYMRYFIRLQLIIVFSQHQCLLEQKKGF